MKLIKSLTAAALLALPVLAPAKTLEVEVNGLVCAFCAQGIEKTLRAFPATEDVFVSLEHRLVAVSGFSCFSRRKSRPAGQGGQ